MRRRPSFVSLIAATILLACWKGGMALAEPPAPLVYRRVLVPSEALDGQIRGLLPLKRDAFDRLLAAAQQQSGAQTTPAFVRIDQAIFRTRLEADQLIGDATLTVSSPGKESALLSLEPCSFSIESAQWNDGDSRVVVYGRDTERRLTCLVESSGELALRWRQAASSAAAESLTFELHLPDCPRRLLEINAPADLDLSFAGGTTIAKEPIPAELGRRTWIFEVAAQGNLSLVARPKRASTSPKTQILVRETTNYTVLPAGIDLEATLHLNVSGQAVQELILTPTVDATILNILVDGNSRRFRTRTDEQGQEQYSIDLPGQLTSGDHVLAVTGVSPHAGSDPTVLPRLSLLEGQFQEGTVQIVAPAWMGLHPQPQVGCIQTDAVAATAGRNFDRFSFQLFQPSATIQFTSNRERAPVIADSGTLIQVESSQVKGVFTADLTSTATDRFHVEASIPRHWIIDAIDAQPPESLADRSLASNSPGFHSLSLKLARPLSPASPLRLVIRAHYRRPANNTVLDNSFLRLASIQEARGGRQLVSVQVHDPGARLAVTNPERLPQIPSEQLSSRDRSLLEEQPGPLILEEQPALTHFHAKLSPAAPRYDADIRLRAEVNRHDLTQSVVIRCQPEASAVGSILVGLSPPPAGVMSWRMAGDTTQELPAIRETRATGTASPEHYFRVLLPRPQTASFQLTGEWVATASAESELTLVSLPEAARQQGLLDIHAINARISIENHELQPLPFAPLPGSDDRTLHGRYRYDPARQGKAVVRLAPTDKPQPTAWVESFHLKSYFSAAGACEHQLDLLVHGNGEGSLAFHWPATAIEPRLVLEDGLEEPLSAIAGEQGIRVPLNAAQEQARIRLRYVSAAPSTSYWPLTELTTPVPQPAALVLNRTWEALIPPSLTPLAPGNIHPQPVSATIPVAATISGFARPTIQSVFETLSAGSLTVKLFGLQQPVRSTEPGFVGWQVVREELTYEPTASLPVYRSSAIIALFWCLVLCCFALVACFPRQVKWVPALIVCGCAAALMVAPPWSLFAEAMSAGFVAGGISLLFWQERKFLPKTSGTSQIQTALSAALTGSVSVIVAAILLSWLLSWQSATAAEPNGTRVARPKVVIPIDENQQPAGDYIYLDEKIYERLLQADGLAISGLPRWLLESAQYETTESPQVRGDQAAVDEIRAVFDFYSFGETTVVALPLRREQVLLLEGRARLDGQPVSLSWQADGNELVASVAGTGKHRLELAFGAVARRLEDGLHVTLAVPSAARTTVKLPLGAERRLDPSGLHLFWPTTIPAATSRGVVEAEQYSLWTFRSGSVVLESQLRVRPGSTPLSEIAIEFDPRLRPLPLTTSLISNSRVEIGTPNLLRLDLAEAITSESTIRMSWLWPDASALGSYQLPSVLFRADRLSRNWCALVLESGIALADQSEKLAIPTATQFAAAWGEADETRLAAVWDAATLGTFSVSTLPKKSSFTADETTAWSISENSATATFTARLAEVPRSQFEYRVRVATPFNPDEVSIVQRGRPAAIRWDHNREELLVSLLEQPETNQTLIVRGHLANAAGTRAYALPLIGLQSLPNRNVQLAIYRQADAQLAVDQLEGWTKSGDGSGTYEAGKGRLVVSLRESATTPSSPRVLLRANQPRLNGQMLTHVHQADGDWTAEVDLDLQVTGGVADELRLSIPAEWSGSFDVIPEMEQRLESAAGESRRRLVLRPPVAVTGTWQIRIRGPLQSGLDGVRAPDISVEGQTGIRRLVLLDDGAAGGQYEWDTSGLIALDATSSLNIPPAWRSQNGMLYDVAANRFEATVRPRTMPAESANIPLADLRAEIMGGRRVMLTAEMTVLPTSDRDVEFSLPPDCRLLQTLVDGISRPQLQTGLRSWKLAAPSMALPYCLTIVYDTYLPAGADERTLLRLAAPRFLGARLTKTLWSVGIANAARGDTTTLSEPLSLHAEHKPPSLTANEAELVRLLSLAKANESIAAVQGGNIPPQVLAETFNRFERRFQAVRARLQRTTVGPPNDATLDAIASALDTMVRIRQRLLQAGVPLGDEPKPETAPESVVSDRNIVARFSSNQITHEHSQEEIELTFSVASDTASSQRMLLLAAFSLLAAVFAVVPLVPASRAWVLARFHFVLAALGVAWWLIAPLGWLGLLLAIIATCLALWPGQYVDQPPLPRLEHDR
jgi:hypothetical protein